jgi:AbrB family looped-hinge helix DNA binding protein
VDVADFGDALVVTPRFERRLDRSRISLRLETSERRPSPSASPHWRRYKISSSGQITIRASVRKRWGIGSGAYVDVADLGDAVVIAPVGGADGLVNAWLERDEVAGALEATLGHATGLAASG